MPIRGSRARTSRLRSITPPTRGRAGLGDLEGANRAAGRGALHRSGGRGPPGGCQSARRIRAPARSRSRARAGGGHQAIRHGDRSLMPRRTDIRSILLIGSGPIVIGQACEFDYSGTQACKALREEGYRVILVNSNPATIMTDPEFADRTYVEPMTVDVLERIIAAERPDALLPTIGGQTGLNLALDLAAAGGLERYGVELIGARVDAIRRAEDRDLFKETMASIGLDPPRSGSPRSLAEAARIKAEIGLPLIIRPSRTLGGTGGSFAATDEEFRAAVAWGLDASPVNEVLLEESIAGWKG